MESPTRGALTSTAPRGPEVGSNGQESSPRTEPPGLEPCPLLVPACPPRPPPPPPLTGRRPSTPRRSAPAAAAQRLPAIPPSRPDRQKPGVLLQAYPIERATWMIWGKKSKWWSFHMPACRCFLLSHPRLCCSGFDHPNNTDPGKAAEALRNQLGVLEADFSSINSNQDENPCLSCCISATSMLQGYT